MPYKKRYNKKGPITSRIKTYGKCAAQASADGAAMYQLVKPFLPFNAEYKRVDQNLSITPTTTGVFTLLNGLAPGTDDTERIGRSVRMTSLSWRISQSTNASATTTQVRYMIVIDRQANDAVFAIADLLQAGSEIVSMRAAHSSKRFHWLADFVVTSSNNDLDVVFRKGFARINRKAGVVEFDAGTAGTVADINTNSLHLVTITNEVTNTPTVLFNARLYFLDN